MKPGRFVPLLMAAAAAVALLALGVAALVVLGAMVLFGVGSFVETSEENLPRAKLESVGQLRLPPSARDIHSKREGFQDDLLHTRFVIAGADLPALEASTCTLGPTTSGPPPAMLDPMPKLAWWKPEMILQHRTCRREGPGFTQTVSVDVTSMKDVVVYLMLVER